MISWRARNTRVAALALAILSAAVGFWWWQREAPILPEETAAFVAIFHQAPGSEDSPQTRRELDELLLLQQDRSVADVEAARADRRKDIKRFYRALGLDPASAPPLLRLHALMERVEDDVSRHVGDAKQKFRRARPYVIEPRLEPCVGGVRDHASYPSGHATYGWVMAYLLSDMVPDKRAALEERAMEYARQRMVCGVHYPSDLEAGRLGAKWLARALLQDPGYREAAAPASRELLAALAARNVNGTSR